MSAFSVLTFFKRPPKTNNVVVHDSDLLVRYPPLRNGVPFYSSKDVLFPHAKLIDQIRATVRFTHSQSDELLIPLLTRFADYVHLLPASEHDHHRTAGGLIRHSLEVGYYSAHTANASVFGLDSGESYQSKVKDLYSYASFLLGLLHDIGKVVSDMSAITVCGKHEWHPSLCSIQDWFLTLPQQTTYQVRWNRRKNKLHEYLYPAILGSIVSKADIAYVTKNGEFPEIYDAILLSLSKSPIASKITDVNLLMKLSKRADARSVNRDLDGKMDTHGDDQASIPLHETLVAKLISLTDSGIFEISGPKTKFIQIDQKIYIVWNESVCFKLIEACLNSGISLPENTKKVFDILYRNNIIKGKSNSTAAISISIDLQGITKKVSVFELHHPLIREYFKSHQPQVGKHVDAKQNKSDQPAKPKPAKPETKKTNTPNSLNQNSIDFNPAPNPPSVSTQLDTDVEFKPNKTKQTKQTKSSNPQKKVDANSIAISITRLIKSGSLDEFETQSDGTTYTINASSDQLFSSLSKHLDTKKYLIRQWIETSLEPKHIDVNTIQIEVPFSCPT